MIWGSIQRPAIRHLKTVVRGNEHTGSTSLAVAGRSQQVSPSCAPIRGRLCFVCADSKALLSHHRKSVMPTTVLVNEQTRYIQQLTRGCSSRHASHPVFRFGTRVGGQHAEYVGCETAREKITEATGMVCQGRKIRQPPSTRSRRGLSSQYLMRRPITPTVQLFLSLRISYLRAHRQRAHWLPRSDLLDNTRVSLSIDMLTPPHPPASTSTPTGNHDRHQHAYSIISSPPACSGCMVCCRASCSCASRCRYPDTRCLSEYELSILARAIPIEEHISEFKDHKNRKSDRQCSRRLVTNMDMSRCPALPASLPF
ncbi:uncharacterized protein B0H18DRAFT_424802 [Fomitopsis serialis]|uniref:uncharacterized protein n=1 Tax=Fomitopsis serialis TaxID=139415 RepID=UPI0020080C85|nr:uncharacterized protein B0H18DRAFT_424802 [Neoantrodia serialis]KAH9924530.1 hypothetical protein B0H18DRAFT_424802 [Neoantrodia serialis]